MEETFPHLASSEMAPGDRSLLQLLLESVAGGTTTHYVYVLFFLVSAHVEGPPLIDSASHLHCNERDDYTDRHYVVECIRLYRWVCLWNESSKVLVVNP